MGVAFQRWDVTAVAVAVDHAAVSKGSVGKFHHGRLLEVGGHPHFQMERVVSLIQRQCHENLGLFRTSAPLFAYCWAIKVRIIKFYDTVKLMCFIPLPHSNADAFEHEPGGFIGRPEHCFQLNG